MSRSVDTKVVEMQFDNKKFEKNAKKTMKTLDELKDSLKFEEETEKIDELQESLDKVSFKNLEDSTRSVEVHFSLLEKIKNAFIDRWVNSFADAAKRTAKSLSTDQISAGFSKYEQQTVSIRTIMNATGKSIDEVEGYMKKLSWFSDETSYDIATMTDALGSLTAAGGNIETLIPMIEGIANATSYAGKGAAEFTRSIYNINQSYSQGYFTYMDWKSLEQAGVATKDLKQTFIDTAKALGKLNAEGKTANGTLVTTGNIGTTLSEKWLDKEVIEQSFAKFAQYSEMAYEMVQDQTNSIEWAAEAYDLLSEKYDDIYIKAAKSAQETKTFAESMNAVKDAVSTQWSNIFKSIFGNTEEATVLWSDFTEKLLEVFTGDLSYWAKQFDMWKALGGRDNLIKGFNNLWDAVSKVFGAIRDGWRTIFPKKTATDLLNITDGFRSWSEAIQPTEKTLDKLKRTFAGLGAAFDMVGRFLKSLIRNLFPGINQSVNALGSGVGAATSTFGDFLVKLNKATKDSRTFENAGKSLAKALMFVHDRIVALFKWIKNLFSKDKTEDIKEINNEVENVSDTVETMDDKVQNAVKTLDNAGMTIKSVVTGIWNKISSTFTKIGDFIKEIFAKIKDSFKKTNDEMENTSEVAKNTSNIFTNIWNRILTIFDSIKTAFHNTFKPANDEMTEYADNTEKAAASTEGFLARTRDKIIEVWTNIKESKMVEFIENVLDKFSSIILKFLGIIEQVLIIIEDAAATATIRDLRDALLDILRGGLIMNFGKSMKTFSEFFSGLGKTVGDVGDVLETLKSAINKGTKGTKTKILKEIAVSLILLATSMLIISAIPKEQIEASLGSVLAILTTFITELMALDAVMSKNPLRGSNFLSISKKGFVADFDKGIGQFSVLLIGLSISVLIFSAALKNIVKVFKECEDNIALAWEAIGAVAGLAFSLLIAIGVFAVLFNKSFSRSNNFGFLKGSNKTIKQLALMVLMIGASIWLLANAVSVIASIESQQGMWDALKAVESLLLIIAGIALIMLAVSEELKRGQAAFLLFSAGVLVLSLGLLVMADVLSKIGEMDSTIVEKGLETLQRIIFLLALVAIAINGVSGHFEGNGQAAFLLSALGVLSIALAVKMLVAIVSDLGEMDQTIFETGFSNLQRIIFLMALVAIAINGVSGHFGGKGMATFLLTATGMLVLVLALLPLVLAMYLFGKMDPQVLAQGLSVLLIVMTMMTLMEVLIAVMNRVAGSNGIVNAALSIIILSVAMSALAVALLLLAGPFKLLESIEWDAIYKATAIILLFAMSAMLIGLMAPQIALGAAVLLLLNIALSTLAFGLLMFGAAALAFGAGVYLITLGIQQLSGDDPNSGFELFSKVLNKIIGFIWALVGAMLILSVSLVVAGAGMLLLGAGGIVAAAGIGLMAAAYMGLAAAVELYALAVEALAKAKERLNAAGGEDLGTKISTGLSNLVGGIKDLGKKAGEGFVSMFNKSTGIHSPSKDTEQSGEFLKEGLKKGISGIGEVGEDAGNDVLDGMKESLNQNTMLDSLKEAGLSKDGMTAMGTDISSSFKDGFSSVDMSTLGSSFDTKEIEKMFEDSDISSPTITPVLDMSTLEAQAGGIDLQSMLGGSSISGANLLQGNAFNTSSLGQMFSNGSAGSTNVSGDQITINVYAQPGQSTQDIAFEVNNILQQRSDMKTRTWGLKDLVKRKAY